jgi:hypothetical protein
LLPFVGDQGLYRQAPLSRQGQFVRLGGVSSGKDASSLSTSIALRRFKNSSQHCRRRGSDISSSGSNFLLAINNLRIATSVRPCLRKIFRSAEFSLRNFSAEWKIDMIMPTGLGVFRLAITDVLFLHRAGVEGGTSEPQPFSDEPPGAQIRSRQLTHLLACARSAVLLLERSAAIPS